MARAEPDLGEFRRLNPRNNRKQRCQIALAADLLSRTDAVKLRAAADAPDITSTAIRSWLHARGVTSTINPSGVASHRRGTCTCADG